MKYLTNLAFWAKIIDGCEEPSPNPFNRRKPPAKSSIRNGLRINFKIIPTSGPTKGSVSISIHCKGKFKLVLHTKNQLDTIRYYDRTDDVSLPPNHVKLFAYDDAFVIAHNEVEAHQLTLMRNMTKDKFEDEVLRLSLAI